MLQELKPAGRDVVVSSNCMGYAARQLETIDRERVIWPDEWRMFFGKFQRQRIETEDIEIPSNAVAVAIVQDSDRGPFFPEHIAVFSPNRQSLTHRPHTNAQIEPTSMHALFQEWQGREFYLLLD